MISCPLIYIQVTGQLHTLATSRPGKVHPFSIQWEVGLDTLEMRKISCPCWELSHDLPILYYSYHAFSYIHDKYLVLIMNCVL
jgi:hypothetical protein